MSKKGRPVGVKKPAITSSGLVKEVFFIIDETKVSYTELARKIGVHNVSLSRWKRGRSAPSIIDLENLASEVGYKLKLVAEENENF